MPLENNRWSPGRIESIIIDNDAMVNDKPLVESFQTRYPASTPRAVIHAPGRVNLLGEHIDYNDGVVLPIAIGPGVRLVAGTASDGRIRVYTALLGKDLVFTVDDLAAQVRPGWTAYVAGGAIELAREGVSLKPACLYVDSDLPMGAGLASSAALEVAVAMGLLAIAGATMAPQHLAAVCRRAEHRHAGVPCGMMDQLVCTMAVADTVLSIDCRTEDVAYLPWPDRDMGVVIVDSGLSHDLAAGAYAERVTECRAALERVRALDATVQSWRDVTTRHLADPQLQMEPPLFRRACHVVSEIDRVMEASEALRHGDLPALGSLMNEGHASLRDDFEVSTPRMDELLRVLQETPGVLGARMTGAGFGGCAIALTRRDNLWALEEVVRKRYVGMEGRETPVIWATPSAGAGITELR